MTYHTGAKHTVQEKHWALFPHFCGSPDSVESFMSTAFCKQFSLSSMKVKVIEIWRIKRKEETSSCLSLQWCCIRRRSSKRV